MDLQSALQTAYVGSKYSLQELYLYGDASAADFYVDAVYIGKSPTTQDENGTNGFIHRTEVVVFVHKRGQFSEVKPNVQLYTAGL